MQRTAAMPAGLDVPTGTVQRIVAAGAGKGLFILPTTRQTLRDARRLVSASPCILIGDSEVIPGAISPAAYLAQLRTDFPSDTPQQLAIAFTDQLVSAHHASLLVERAGQLEFMPVLEVLASCRYAVSVHIWDGLNAGLVNESQGTAVLQRVAAYFDACNGLGDAWLMRDRQQQRLPAQRVDIARRRLRLYQSTLFNSSVDAPLSISALKTVRELGALRAGLTAKGDK